MTQKLAEKQKGRLFYNAAEVMNLYFPDARPRTADQPDVLATANRMVATLLATAGKPPTSAKGRRGQQRHARTGA